MYGEIKKHLQYELQTIEEKGIFKKERIITSSQGAEITISPGEKGWSFRLVRPRFRAMEWSQEPGTFPAVA